ncbi:hypothetical protein TIFTF001_045322 [Ficus carica]|uniref:Uncharacterized protein n=1 Tax=Ficus carica TaxID=3494 RepID=A0AA87Z1W9_FICCA|nr:hypothetical protein TIFTF001_045322 [Ficus carica]
MCYIGLQPSILGLQLLIPKIYGTTPNVVVRLDRSYIVTLHLVTCKKETPRSDGDTSRVSVKDTPMLKSIMLLVNVLSGLGYSCDSIELNSESSRRVDMLQSEWATNIGDGTSAITGGMSGVKRGIVSVVPGHCCQPVLGDVT